MQVFPLRDGLTPDEFECKGRRRSPWYTKAELSNRADSETPRRLPHAEYVLHRPGYSQRKISYWVKDGSGTIYAEGSIAATRLDLDCWIKTLPQPWTAAMEATVFTGWIYDHLKPHATALKVAHPLMLRAIPFATVSPCPYKDPLGGSRTEEDECALEQIKHPQAAKSRLKQ
jgi:hypothetical protein